MAQGHATVKSVLSGDTIVLLGRGAPNAPPPELQVSLASIQAPRLSRHPDAVDEPFAWQSREFLRRMIVGQAVRFKVQYKVESINRQFADVWFKDELISTIMTREGWAKAVSPEMTKHGASQEYEQLQALTGAAEAEKRGMFTDDAKLRESAIRPLKWSIDDATVVFKDLRNEVQPAVVEQVRDGGSLRCILTKPMMVINFNMAGLQCPRVGGGVNATAPQPFAAEAKFFTETRLLNRDVMLDLGGIDKFNNFFGQVRHPAGDIAVELLKNGLGRMVDWSMNFTSPAHVATMRAAEKGAKSNRLRIWRDWEPVKVSGESRYSGKVIEVVSGDTMIVQVARGSDTEERRVQLSSIRAPRLGRRSDADQPWAWEAKESLRRLAIGREVDVQIDYTKPPVENAPTQEERRFGTIVLVTRKGSRVNVAEKLVSEGYAEVMRHRADDARSPSYDDLLAAEVAAKEAKRGLHSTKSAPLHRITDLTTDGHKSKEFFPFLQRAGRMKAIVDFVVAGGRVKLLIPSENCVCMFAISGVRCPAVGRAAGRGADGKMRPARQGESFGPEALAFMRENTLQREVEVEAESVDQRGTILGPLWVGEKNQQRNVGIELLQNGLATTIAAVAERSRFANELFGAEDAAKNARRGVWEKYETETEAAQQAEEQQQFVEMTVCDIVDGNNFYAHAKRDLDSLRSVEQSMMELKAEVGEAHAVVDPKRGKLVCGLYNDGTPEAPKWFRARIEGRGASSDSVRVVYIDYGNSNEVPVTKLRPLPSPNLGKIPPLARACRLAFIKSNPLGEEWGHEAGVCLSRNAFNRELIAKIHSRDSQNRLVVSLFDEKSNQSINELMIREGVARIAKREFREAKQKARQNPTAEGLQQDAQLLDALKAAQNEVAKQRSGMWQYGDVADSDTEQAGP